MTASIRSFSRNFFRISFSAPPRKRTPWGMTVTTMPPGLQTEHVLGEHEVAFLARGGTPAPAKALGELHVAARVILAERGVGNHAVEALQFAGFTMHRMEQRVLELDIRARHSVEEHVEPADRPRGCVVDLAAEAEVRRVAAGLLDELPADDEHAARAAGGVVDAHPRRWLENANHETDNIARSIEVAAFLAGRFGEH